MSIKELREAVEWLPVKGFEGRYEISRSGLVLSLVRAKPAILAHVFCDKGYPMVHLSDGRGNSATRKVHRLVAEAFLGQRPNGTEIRHLDGNKKNPSVANLAYGTRRENLLDRKRHELPKTYRLRPHDVLAIRARLAEGATTVELAREFDVSRHAISDIKRGRRHVDI